MQLTGISQPATGLAKRSALALLAIAGLAGCASRPQPSDADIGCIAWHQVPITVGDKVHFVRGHCKAWQFGPSRTQREDFERRSAGAR